jgi:hypothetical protein
MVIWHSVVQSLGMDLADICYIRKDSGRRTDDSQGPDIGWGAHKKLFLP